MPAMGVLKKIGIFVLPFALYAAFKFLKTYFLIFVLLLNPFLPRLPLQRYQELNPDINDFVTSDELLLDDYDFIIVGAGSAGAVVANRLASENESWNILLLEAGGGETMLTEIPGLSVNNILEKENWGYKTEPAADGKTSTMMKDGAVLWPRGKVLGGSSSINGMVYTRGNKKDYDLWHELGNEGWDFDSVLPYFKKSEDMQIKDHLESGYHSSGGRLPVTETANMHPSQYELMDACTSVLPYNPDYNGDSQTGCVYYQHTKENGQRCSTAKQFLKKRTTKPSNLHVSAFSHVHKINIDDSARNNRATGVTLKKGNKMVTISARKEVIVSAGTIGSPQLLMLSGIGPKEELDKFDIPVIKDAHVGYNLQDHVSVFMHFVFNDSASMTFEELTDYDTFKEYYDHGTGLLSQFLSFGMFLPTTEESEINDWPELQGHFLPALVASNKLLLQDVFNIDETYWKDQFSSIANEHGFTMSLCLLRPKSKGRIKLKSGNAEDHPAIYSNYFDDPEDLKPFYKGFEIMKKMANGFDKYNATFYDKKDPDCMEFEQDSNEYIGCYARKVAGTLYHPVGTCKMGPQTDREAVVDARLKVYGIDGLRVIDASIMPNIVSGNTNAAAIMIGEKGADLIKEDWQ